MAFTYEPPRSVGSPAQSPDGGEAPPLTPLAQLADDELLAIWADAMDELRQRNLVRSANNPVGDVAEALVAKRLRLTLVGNSTAGYDAVDHDGTRYQIKSRRLVPPRRSRQLSPLRNLDQDPFDYLIVVLFGRTFDLVERWQFPIAVVREHAKYKAHVNGHILHVHGAVLLDPRSIRLA